MTKADSLTRHQFIQRAFFGASGLVAVPLIAGFAAQEKPAPMKIDLVKEFVSSAHGKFDRVKEMLESDHLLLHCSYDWGGGDFESAIEAAGHVGNKDIAHYLIGKGARYNIYLACMLGHLEVVRNVLTISPGLLNSKGPHALPCYIMHKKEGWTQSR